MTVGARRDRGWRLPPGSLARARGVRSVRGARGMRVASVVRVGLVTPLAVVALLWGVGPAAGSALEPFPLAGIVSQCRSNLARAAAVPVTGLKRDDYLGVISGIAGYFRRFQAADGRIVDPFEHKERQYSTPCFAWAAAALLAGRGQTDLLEPASLALDSALQQLADGQAADGHGDFFLFPAMLAFEELRGRVGAARRERWEELLRRLEPARAYRDRLTAEHRAVNNWNVVALAGEFLRQQDGFGDGAFVAEYLPRQMEHFTAHGLYRDPKVPMAYDHFPRHFLAVLLARGAARESGAELATLLDRAAWTSLLMQSPLGELPTGGRSAQHQWNEAEQCVTYEIWAARKAREGDMVSARAFKRGARLALQSIRRWVRPSGELWIVKNRFDPALRHGFEGYSFHSQYNLLAASMLATAWRFGDDAIPEGVSPADEGGFAFALPEFHKVFANAGGFYLEIDTDADPNYNSTGLIRVHRRGVDGLVGGSDGTAGKDGALALGVAWREGGGWQALAGCHGRDLRETRFQVAKASPALVQFTVRYELARAAARAVTESYELAPDELRVTAEVQGEIQALRVRLPALVFDGQRTAELGLEGDTATMRLGRSRRIVKVVSPDGVRWQRGGRLISNRNGFLEAIEGEAAGRKICFSLSLSPVP